MAAKKPDKNSPLEVLRQIHALAGRVIAEADSGEEIAPAQARTPLPPMAAREYIRPLIDTFQPGELFVTKNVLAKFEQRYPIYRTSEQTVARCLNSFAEEGLLDRVGTGWRVKTRLKSVNRGAA
jgi:hypothetical protein